MCKLNEFNSFAERSDRALGGSSIRQERGGERGTFLVDLSFGFSFRNSETLSLPLWQPAVELESE